MAEIASALDLIRHHEGYRARVYDDATGFPVAPGSRVQGHPTIGWGRCLDTRGITATEAEYLLKNDLAAVRAEAEKYHWFYDLNEPRQAVVMSLIFQLGPAGFRQFHRTRKALSNGNYEQASVEMLDSKWAEQTPERANHQAMIMLTGAWEGLS